jgi:hypothetical protein
LKWQTLNPTPHAEEEWPLLSHRNGTLAYRVRAYLIVPWPCTLHWNKLRDSFHQVTAITYSDPLHLFHLVVLMFTLELYSSNVDQMQSCGRFLEQWGVYRRAEWLSPLAMKPMPWNIPITRCAETPWLLEYSCGFNNIPPNQGSPLGN